MRLKKLWLENFRNYQTAQALVDNDLVLVLGDNASGKTNLLEGLYFLSRLKSFRAPNNFLVKNQEDYFRVGAENIDHIWEASVQISPSARRMLKIDNRKTTLAGWKTFRTVLFVPQDLNIFHLGPSLRRRFLDETLLQTNAGYGADLVMLEHVLKHRSRLLIAGREQPNVLNQLPLWNEQLAEISLRVSAARRGLVSFMSGRFRQHYGKLFGQTEELDLVYTGAKEEETREGFLKKLQSLQTLEVRLGQNLLGPHRDDLVLSKDRKPNIHVSSRGELRAQVLVLKLLQAQALSQNQDRPIVLLDDVFSELDETRRSKTLDAFSENQVFIASTEEHHLPKLRQRATIIKVSAGKIEQN